MINAKLNLVYAHGQEQPTPSFDKIQTDYFHAANIRTKAKDVSDLEQDLNKVIILRPEVKSRYIVDKGSGVLKGYFAWGEQEKEQVTFKIFPPFPTVKSNFPPKTLETAIALFTLELIKEGYVIRLHGVEFTTQTNKE